VFGVRGRIEATDGTIDGTLTFGSSGSIVAPGNTLVIDQTGMTINDNVGSVGIWFDVGGSLEAYIRMANDGSGNDYLRLLSTDGIQLSSNKMGFFGTIPISKPTVTGDRSLGTALTNLLIALETLGLITDSTVA
jgi:hypothetical protein